ncbi:protein spinster homolog 3 isoform X11 [Prionailurus viverrinus]|uniref:protein spinster homolog 3 isoform X11 n=1 Tax=Prionailurus viverrinus TaxID=61388 RepID=UPI001FF5321B|nr:protein spinster homolog 3 isoform X11 [Prionailurus viverrinus]
MSITSAQRMRTQAWGGASGGGGSGRRAHLRPRTRPPPSEGGDGFSLHRLPAAVCTCVWLPGRPTQPQSYAEHWDPALVRGGPLQLLHFPPVFLAVLPVPGSRGHRLGQLLHHRAHHSGRPLCEGPADPGAGHLLHLYPCRKLELCVVHPWGDCHRLCDWSSGLLGPQISVRGPCGAWTAAPLPPGAVQQPGQKAPSGDLLGIRSEEPFPRQQPDFWGADCRDWHHWSCPGSRGFQEVQESQPSGRAPPLRRQPSGRSPLPLPGSHPGPDHVPGLLCAPGPRGAASVLQLGGGCRHPAVRGGAQVPGDSRGFADHSGPHPGGRQQPLPYWTGVQHPEGRAPRLLPAGLPQPPAEFPVLCICHCPGRGLLPADSAAPGVGPGPGPGAWHRDPGQRGHGEASPAFWRGHRHRGPLRPPPSCPPPCTPPAGRRSIRALSPSGCGSGPPAELHLSFLPSQPESWQGLWRELSCQRLRREAWACARPAPGPQTGWLPVGPD